MFYAIFFFHLLCLKILSCLLICFFGLLPYNVFFKSIKFCYSWCVIWFLWQLLAVNLKVVRVVHRTRFHKNIKWHMNWVSRKVRIRNLWEICSPFMIRFFGFVHFWSLFNISLVWNWAFSLGKLIYWWHSCRIREKCR